MIRAVSIHGLTVNVENPKGSIRAGMGPNGSWQSELRHDYGDIAGPVLGADGDPVDVFLGPDEKSPLAFVVNQVKPDGSFDEHKVMLGFTSRDEAASAYLQNYETGWMGMGSIAAMDIGSLISWLHAGDLSQPAPAMPQVGLTPSADATAYDMQDAILIGDSQYEVTDAAGGKVRLRMLASLAGVPNINNRYFTTDFFRAMLPAANAYVDAVPRYGEEPHPPFDSERQAYVTNLSNKIWDQGHWFVNDAGHLGCEVFLDPKKPREAAVIAQQKEYGRTAGSVRWHAQKPPKTGRTPEGRQVQLFDADVARYCYAAVFDYVPNPAVIQAGKFVDADSGSLFALTDATAPQPSVAVTEVADTPAVPAIPVPTLDTNLDPSPQVATPGPKTTQPLKENRPVNSADLRAKAAKTEDAEAKQALLDAADALEAQPAPPTVDVNAIADAVRAQLAPQFAAADKAAQYADTQAAQQATAAERAKVVALADSVQNGDAPEVARFTDTETRKAMADAIRTCDSEIAARQKLESEIATTDRISAAVRLQTAGLNTLPGGTPALDASRVEVIADAGDKQIAEARQRLTDAFDNYALNSGNPVDLRLRETNKAFVEKLKGQKKRDQSVIADSAALLLETDDAKKSVISKRIIDATRGMVELSDAAGMTDASVTTAAVLNQGLLGDFILERAYQDLEALPLCEGIGKEGMSGGVGGQSNIGTTLRIMTEYQTPAPHDYQGLDFDSLIVGESQGIPQTSMNTQYQEFAVRPRRIGFSVTKDVEMAMLHGPMNYDVTARTLYHTLYEWQRDTNSSLYLEMVTTADELGAVAVSGETAATADFTTGNTQDGKTYGANVAFIYQPACGGNNTGASRYSGIATPSANSAYRTPLIVPRPVRTISSAGVVSDSIANAITVAKTGSGARTLVRGYLDPNGNIASKIDVASGNTLTADYAVDFATGKFLFTAAAGVVYSTITLSYSYTTNCDFFQVNFGANPYPNSLKAADYFSSIFTANDQSVAKMAQYPVFAPPNICLSTRLGSVPLRNAAIFYRFNSPTGTTLNVASSNLYAERDGVNYVQMNAPSILGDDTLLFFQKGVTKFGVDYAAHTEGPFAAYDTATGRMKDEKNYYMAEGSVRCTPLARDGNGKAFNAKLRKRILY